MPLYEYQCAKCGKRFEKIEKVSAPRKQKCPHCGGKAERLFSAPGFHFKGSGWYVTDYAGKGKVPAGETDTGKTDTGKAETKEGKETKEVKDTKDTKEKKDTAAKDTGKKAQKK